MAITITTGIQKGGCSKSTTTGVLAHLLRRDGYRILAIDLDSQAINQSNQYKKTCTYHKLKYTILSLFLHYSLIATEEPSPLTRYRLSPYPQAEALSP